jgi:hypothetical protein
MIFKNIIKITSLIAMVLAMAISSCRKEPVLAEGTKKICFDSQVLNVIVNNCAMSGCHSSGGGELKDLSTYEGIKSYVKAGDPNKSKLYNVITAKGLVTTIMPPKPRPQLKVSEVNDITIWILQGAENTTCP